MEAPVLLVMNKDGSGKKNLLEDYLKKDSPLLDQLLWPCLISPDGGKVAFMTRDWKNKKYGICSINSDGTRLQSQPLNLPEVDWLRFVGWEMSGKSIIISALSKWGTEESNSEILSFGLDTGSYKILAKNLRNPYSARVSENGDSMVFKFYDEKDSKEVLAKVDLRSLEKEEIYRSDSIDGFCLSEAGHKIAFIADKSKLGIYSLPEKKMKAIKAIKELKAEKQSSLSYSLSWVSDGKKVVFSDNINGGNYLRVFGEDLRQKKAIKMLFSPWRAQISALGNIVFVPNFMTQELWTVDIDTEKWRKLY
jgi:Tol biopolymer transport system component